MNHFPILSVLIWLPVLGAMAVLLFASDARVHYARMIALLVSLVSLVLCVMMWAHFDTSTAMMQFRETVAWIPSYKINYDVGVDGISMPLVVLTCFTTLVVVLASWTMVHEKVAQYLAAFLVMQAAVIGVFVALDSMLFYFFWEAMLIPMYLSIGIWGGENRSYAAIKFFLYTFLGSVLLLVAILYLRMHSGTFDILGFFHLKLSQPVQNMLFLGFFLAFRSGKKTLDSKLTQTMIITNISG